MVKQVSGGIEKTDLLVRYALPGKLTDSAGAIKQLNHYTYTSQNVPANGDLFYLDFILDGTETKLNIGTYAGTNRGIWRWKLNDFTEDTTDYDDYAGASAETQREIDVTGKTLNGANVLRLRLNGKNALSTDYYLLLFGVSIQ